MTRVFVGSIAQRLEQGTHNPLVPGSNPGGPKPEREDIHRLWTEKVGKEKISGVKSPDWV